jgi:hypothetical protein
MHERPLRHRPTPARLGQPLRENTSVIALAKAVKLCKRLAYVRCWTHYVEKFRECKLLSFQVCPVRWARVRPKPLVKCQRAKARSMRDVFMGCTVGRAARAELQAAWVASSQLVH